MRSWSIGLSIGARPTGRMGGIEMLTLHPNILEIDGKKAFAVLPYEEFQDLQEELDQYEDLKDLRTAKASEANAPTSSLRSVRDRLKI